MFDNPLLLMLLVLAIAIMAGYYYLKRAQSRDHATRDELDGPTDVS